MARNTNRRHSAAGRTWRRGRSAVTGVVLATLLSCGSVPAYGQLTGDLSLLKLTAEAHRSNQSKILTWQGRATVARETRDERGERSRSANIATFATDTTADAARWSWQIIKQYERVDGKLSEVTPPALESREMKKGDAFYCYSPLVVADDGSRKYSLVIQPAKEANSRKGADSFDPLYYLTMLGLDLPELLEFNYRVGPDPKMPPGYVKRQADLVIWHTEQNGVVRHHEFDLGKGGNLVLYYTTSPQLDSRLEWTYEKQGEAWVPKSHREHCRNKNDGSTRDFDETIGFTQNVVNQPISPETFTLKAMGVSIGTYVSDNRVGAIYHYGGEPDESWEFAEDLLSAAKVRPETQPLNVPELNKPQPEPDPLNVAELNKPRAAAPTPGGLPGAVGSNALGGCTPYVVAALAVVLLAAGFLIWVARRKSRRSQR